MLLEHLQRKNPNRFSILGALGVARALHGDREDAERISVQLDGISVPYSFGNTTVWQARIAAALGNRDQAMVFLRRAFSEGTSRGGWIHREPAFRSMVDHPTIQDLLQPSG